MIELDHLRQVEEWDDILEVIKADLKAKKDWKPLLDKAFTNLEDNIVTRSK